MDGLHSIDSYQPLLDPSLKTPSNPKPSVSGNSSGNPGAADGLLRGDQVDIQSQTRVNNEQASSVLLESAEKAREVLASLREEIEANEQLSLEAHELSAGRVLNLLN